MSPVAIGNRNIRGTIESPTVVTEDSGYEEETYGPLATCPIEWVMILPMTGREFLNAHQVFHALTARLRMRYRSDLTAEMRFVTDDGVVWQFQSPPIDPDGKKREIEIMVTTSG